MAFPNNPHNPLAILLPDDLHYNYAYSTQSNSPYSPDFPSTPSLHDDPFTPNIYQNPDDFYPQTYNCASDPHTIHAPTPLPGQSPLLRSDSHKFSYPFLSSPNSPSVDYLSHDPLQIPSDLIYEDPVQITFPTPSELLVELSGRNPSTDQLRVEKKSESRKARRRAVAKSVGFVPTDPDTISSHDKKRHYLECLEHYVMYLHEQLHLVGAEPVNLERVSNYRGLNSRSIRTLLVHMENTNRKLNLHTLDEEQRFMTLRDAVCRQDAAATSSTATFATESSTNWQW